MRFITRVVVSSAVMSVISAYGGFELVKPNAELKRELERYSLKAFSYSDERGKIAGLVRRPTADSKAKVPLVVYIPGCGEKGDLIRQFRHRSLFEKISDPGFQRQHPSYLIAVSPPSSVKTIVGGMPGQPNAIQGLIHDMISEYCERAKNPEIDLDRVYLTGFSFGGSGVCALELQYPGEYAACVPIAPIPPAMEYFNAEHPGNWWHFFNEGDYSSHGIGMDEVEAFADAVRKAGGDYRLGTFPGGGHDAWTKAWSEDGMWRWMFSKTASGRKLTVAEKKSQGEELMLSDVKCSSNVKAKDAGMCPERVTDGLDETAFVPMRAFDRNDWWMAEFAKPVSGRFRIITGDRSGRGKVSKAVVEVSMNGRSWTRVGSFGKDGCCEFTRTGKISFLRVKVTGSKPTAFVLRRLILFKR